MNRGYNDDFIRTLEADIHNVKSRNNPGLHKLLQIFKKENFKTVKDFYEYLNNKWNN